MVGTGEYTTGYVHGAMSTSDKGPGVVALVMFDLKKRGKVSDLSLCGVNGKKFPGIRAHMKRCIGDIYTGLDTEVQTFPGDSSVQGDAYIQAFEALSPGDAVTIFTPDDTHFEIAMAAVKRGLHVLATKPVVKTVEEHLALAKAAKENNVLVQVEVHKRFDPIYADARDRIGSLGDFSFFQSYMSQPKKQLETFKAWAGKASDISYYLNSHHVDFHAWALQGKAHPTVVSALGSTGVANKVCVVPTEDTITLSVQWTNNVSENQGHALYTSSWIAPPSDVHSQQRFHYMGSTGEVQVDQGHRGYTLAQEDASFRQVNPLFMKYAPNPKGEFAGQHGYGFRSFELFIDAITALNSEQAQLSDYDGIGGLPTIHNSVVVTAILEAGRRSLDKGGLPQELVYDKQGQLTDIRAVSAVRPSNSPSKRQRK